MKTLLSAVAVVMLLGAATAAPAEAACWATPGGWECWHPHPHPYWGWHHWHEWHHGW